MSATPKPPANEPIDAAFVVQFGSGANEETAAAAGVFSLPIPVLGGIVDEAIFEHARELPTSNGFRLFEHCGLLIGALSEPAETDLTAQTHAVYQRLLKLAGGRRLARVWNYVPRINELDSTGLENYRAFCRGRSLAFEEQLGEGYAEHLPAASAVGGVADRLVVIFAAMRGEPAHFENPEQTPAYEYPVEHGPRSPSFARATRIDEGAERYVFISGTAAIKGHATIGTGDLAAQIACSLDNLKIISRASGLGENLGAESGGEWRRHFKIYLRHASDFDAAKASLDSVLLTPTDRVTWLLSDICREALLIEIEATLVSSR